MPKQDPQAPVNSERLDQAVDAIVAGMEKLIKGVEQRLNKRLNRIATDIRDVRRKLIDLEVDSHTRKEFDDLKERVDEYHPLT